MTNKIIQCFVFLLSVFMVINLVACLNGDPQVHTLPSELTLDIPNIEQPTKAEPEQEITLKVEPETVEETITILCDCEMGQYARIPGGVTPARVQIRFIDDETRHYFSDINEFVDISQFSVYHTFTELNWHHSPAGIRTIFTTDITISNFQIITLVYSYQFVDFCCDEFCNCIIINDVLYTLDVLTPETPLVAEWINTGCFTTGRGVSFIYDGVTRYFDIVLESYDGHIYMAEFKPKQ